MASKNSKCVSVRGETHEWLRKKAAEEGRTIASVVEGFIHEHIDAGRKETTNGNTTD